jgi:Asp-tRNA(Asn)/Glu-tRNA(Gln) amidotransferase A subunit family amidase
MTDLTELTLAEAGALLHRREVTSEELLDATLARIEETEPALHAYAHVMADGARREARRADAEIARRGQSRGPLHGIPIGVKDLCHTHDAPTEAGSRVLAGARPDWDATVVRRLRDGGAVVVGKTVTDEFAYGQAPCPTRNPWSTDCSPGGSSAGSGSAVAARSAFGAVGTDGGGSIRAPAALNGVVGLKPTCGLVSRTGVVPMSASLDHVGPLARTARDCALMLDVMAGHDPADPQSLPDVPGRYAADLERGVEGLRIGVELDRFVDPRAPAITRETTERVAAELEGMGAVLVEVSIPMVDLVEPIFYAIMMPDTSAYHRRWLREQPYDYDQGTRIALEVGELIPATHYVNAQRARLLMRDAFRDTFERNGLDVLLTPASGPSAPVADMSRDLFDFTLRLAAGNLTGLPALSVPSGFTPDGLPVAVELYGRPLDERTILRVAHAYHQAYPWPSRRPSLTHLPA